MSSEGKLIVDTQDSVQAHPHERDDDGNSMMQGFERPQHHELHHKIDAGQLTVPVFFSGFLLDHTPHVFLCHVGGLLAKSDLVSPVSVCGLGCHEALPGRPSPPPPARPAPARQLARPPARPPHPPSVALSWPRYLRITLRTSSLCRLRQRSITPRGSPSQARVEFSMSVTTADQERETGEGGGRAGTQKALGDRSPEQTCAGHYRFCAHTASPSVWYKDMPVDAGQDVQ